MSSAQPDKTIDIRGQICPYTLIETRDAIKGLTKGQILEVICDYAPAAQETIPNFCRKKGYPLNVEPDGEATWRLQITRTD